MALPATDTFTGTDGTALTTYSANWTLNANNFAINTNAVYPNSGSENGAHWNADTFANDQYATGTLVAFGSGSVFIGVAVRGDASAASYYGYYVGAGTNKQYLIKMVGGVETDLATDNTTPSVNDVLKLTAVGTTLTPTRNGSTTNCPAATTDTALTSGSAGLAGYSAGTGFRLDNWEGGNTGGTPPPTIPANVIFFWTGTNASIPSGWTRETTLDAKYPKGTANAVNPGGTGGALTHSHTTPNHNHTTAHTHTTPDSSGETGSSNRDSNTTNPPAAHTHVTNAATTNPTTTLANDTPATDSPNNEPPYFTVIFVKSDGTPTGLPNNMVGLWNNVNGTIASWNLCDGGSGRPDMRNVWAKGAAAAGDGGGTGGATTHTHSIVSHTHSTPYAHQHPGVVTSQSATAKTTGDISGATVLVATATHTHTLTINSASPVITGNTDAAASSDHQPPYWVLAFIQNNLGALSFPDRIIGMWLGTLASIPANWALCDGTLGTPDLRALFVKGANTLAGIGSSGGSLTHGATHTATGHTHAVAAHQHTITDQANGASENRTAGATAAATAAHTHTWASNGSSSFTSATGTPTVNDFTNTQPPYVDVAFIQWQAPIMGKLFQSNQAVQRAAIW